MSSGIFKPYDRLFSTKGTEWHGQSEVIPVIDRNSISPILFPIRESQTFCEVDGIRIPSGNKTLIADLRELRPDLVNPVDENQNPAKDDEGNVISALVALHTPKDSYAVIENGDTFDAAVACVAGIEGAEITSAFTLEKCKVFGVSIDIGNNDMSIKRHNGVKDEILGVLNVITSHNGTLACQAYDSTVRIVCMNTLRWSLDAAGEVGFKVYHTKNADSGMRKFPELVNAILLGRANFKNQMEYFDSIAITKDEALYLALAYLDESRTGDAEKASTRILNAADSIQNLFVNGAGNLGQTFYDLLNGVTEYYTTGDGTGMRANEAEKAYKANFGKAADHKNAFVNFLMKASGENKEKTIESGRKLYVEANQ